MKIYQVCFLIIFLINIISISTIQFEVFLDKEKCLRQEVGHDVVVVGEYLVASSFNSILTIQVFDPVGSLVWQNQNAVGQGIFAHTSESSGELKICFLDSLKPGSQDNSHGQGRRQVSLKFKIGAEAKDYSSIAKREDVKPLELEALKLEDLIEDINADIHYLRFRESLMRNTNESTHSRILWLSALSIIVLICLNIFQLLYLKRYFHQKKLI
eukprot:TRINITY_DN492_c2_g1_i1.p1 TRINITY_DN492_c2_g1~~TRINITY_DN492_c2_g1_i1.p1  ORF type:complete len:213 (+),score=77.52 TRINITY_DN492_c2_g1_i1:114-752(+)